MSDDKIADADAAIEKINSRLGGGDVVIFTNDEASALKEVAEAWKSAKGFVTIMRYTGSTLKWFVIFGVTWAAFKAGLFDFLGGKQR